MTVRETILRFPKRGAGRLRRFLLLLASLGLLLCGILPAGPVSAEPAENLLRGGAFLPCSPGQAGAHVLRLQEALASLGYLQEEPSGFYSRATRRAVEAFQHDRGLKVTGSADAETLRLLQGGPDDDKQKTVMPWWYGEGGSLIPPGAEFEIRDVWTRETFRVMRTEGLSHLDAEPLTPADTAAMKQIYGGAWTWARRPILLKYGDLVIAASMNGKPHGTDFIADNAMQGHFCVHLYGSRIDGNQVVDTRHQLCVAEAFYATWD